MQTKTFNVYTHQNTAVQDAYAMLSANIQLSESEKRLKSIVLTSCKPRVGKTTIAISLAFSLAESGWKTLLVDADLRKPAEAKRLNAETIFGLSDFLSNEMNFEDVLCNTNIPNLNYIACGENIKNPIGLFCSAAFDSFMKKAVENFDFVIFDTPSLSSVVDSSLVAAKSDATLLVVKMGETTLNSLKPAIDQLEKVNANLLGAVLNKVKKNNYKKYFEAFDYFNNKSKFIKLSKKHKKMNFDVANEVVIRT